MGARDHLATKTLAHACPGTACGAAQSVPSPSVLFGGAVGHTRGGRVAGSVQGVPCPQENPRQSGHVPITHLRRGSRRWQCWLDPCAGSSPQQHCHGVAASTGIALARYHPSGRSCLEALPALPKHGCALPGCLDPLMPRVSHPPVGCGGEARVAIPAGCMPKR